MSAIAIAPDITPNTMSLAVLASELECLLDTAEMVEEGTADRAELDAMIAEFQEALPAKADRVNYALAFLESQAVLAAAEIKRLQARKARYERDAERLGQYCCRVIEELPEPKRGKRKIEGHTVTLSVTPSDEVIFTDEIAVPISYKTAVLEMPAPAWESIVAAFPDAPTLLSKQDLKVRKADVKKALKAGEDVPGADIKFNVNLRRS